MSTPTPLRLWTLTVKTILLWLIPVVIIFPPEAARAEVFLIRMGGALIGAQDRTIEMGDDGRSVVHERTSIRMMRGEQTIEMGEALTWTESQALGLERFHALRSGFGPEGWEDRAERIDTGWRRSRERGGPSAIDTLRASRLSGPVQIDRLFEAAPESIRIRTLNPTSAEPETFYARFVRVDTLQSPSARIPSRIYAVRDSAGSSPEVLQWRDARGAIWKEVDPTLGWSVERAELAPARGGEATLDVMRVIAIPLEGKPPREGPCTLVIERLAPTSLADEASPIAEGPGQTIRPGKKPGAWVIHLTSPDWPAPSWEEKRRWTEDPTLTDALRPGLIVDSADSTVKAFADRVVEGASTPAEEVRLLALAVRGAVRVRDLGTVLATASQTLRDGQGDCTEHAVLLAACCRARRIPARLVAGLVPNGSEMGFHLWTEAYIGRWTPLDATRSPGATDPCAVALQRWTQPEDGLTGFHISLERMTAGYRFRVPEQANGR